MTASRAEKTRTLGDPDVSNRQKDYYSAAWETQPMLT